MLRSRTNLHPYRVAFWAFALLILALALLDRHPIDLAAEDELSEGSWAPRRGRGDTAVILATEPPAGQATYGYAWVDLIEQEIGPVSALPVDELGAEVYQSFKTLILTADAASTQTAQSQVEALERFSAGGGTLLIELPQGPLRQTFGADGRGGWRQARSITAATGLEPDNLESLGRLPLLVPFKGSTEPRAHAETLLAMDGAPVIYAMRRGEGAVIVADADFGQLLTLIQRGASGPHGQVQQRISGRPPLASDLVSDLSLQGEEVPLADLLERYLVHHVLSFQHPVFALWPVPNGARGALVLSHSASSLDGRPLWRSMHERTLRARTPTFVPAPQSDRLDQAHHWRDEPGHAAFLWHPYPDEAELYQTWNLFGFTPLRRPLPLTEQRDRLSAWLGSNASIQGIRSAEGLWHQEHDAPWRAMDAAGLAYSASLGPSGQLQPGILFGTCQPFRATDSRGRPLRLFEVPICFEHPSDPDSIGQFQAALERAGQEGWAIHLHMNTDGIRSKDDLAASSAWHEALVYAERHQLWIGGPGELAAFRRQRSEAELKVRNWSVQTTMADGRPRVVEFIVEAATQHRGTHLVIPAQLGELRFDSVHRGEAAAQRPAMADRVATTPAQLLGRDVRLLQLHPGFTTVSIRFTR